MARRTIRQLKENGYRLPYLTWLLDRTVIYLVLALIPVIALAYLVKDSYHTVEEIKQPYTPISNYQDVTAKTSPSDSWISGFLSAKAPDNNNWTISPSRAPSQPIEFKQCSSFGLLSPIILKGGTAQGEKTKVVVQTYAPGEVKNGFQDYVKTFSNCWKVEKSSIGDPSTEIARFEDGFFYSYGDALIFVIFEQPVNRELTEEFYVRLAKNTLVQYGCEEVSSKYEDDRRTPYFNPKNYTGLILKDVVQTKLNLKDFPTPSNPSMRELSSMDEPEAPLSPKILRLPAQKPSQPAPFSPPQLNLDIMQKNIAYQVEDSTGPGCGWEWSGQKAPIVNVKELEEKKLSITAAAQNEVDSKASKYIDDRIMYAKNSLLYQKDLNSWNNYVIAVDKVHESWKWLNNERDKLRQPWDTYVANHDLWITFDDRKARALEKYNSEVNKCNDANNAVNQWETQWGEIYRRQQERIERERSYQDPTPIPTEVMVTPEPTPTVTTGPDGQPTLQYITPEATPSTIYSTPTPTPTSTEPLIDIPEKPEGCYSIPERPSIIDREKGPEPTPPILPDGVTIPDSWEKPKS